MSGHSNHCCDLMRAMFEALFNALNKRFNYSFY